MSTTDNRTNEDQAYAAFISEWAKQGLPASSGKQLCHASKPELLQMRTNNRKLINSIAERAQNEKRNFTNQELLAMEHAAKVISKVSMQLDMNESMSAHFSTDARDNATAGVTMLSNSTLRSAEAIASALNIQPDSDAPRMAEFLRGIAGMKTSDAFRNALSVGTDSAGGYSVPSVLMPDILAALVPNSSLLSAGAKLAILTE